MVELSDLACTFFAQHYWTAGVCNTPLSWLNPSCHSCCVSCISPQACHHDLYPRSHQLMVPSATGKAGLAARYGLSSHRREHSHPLPPLGKQGLGGADAEWGCGSKPADSCSSGCLRSFSFWVGMGPGDAPLASNSRSETKWQKGSGRTVQPRGDRMQPGSTLKPLSSSQVGTGYRHAAAAGESRMETGLD